MVYKDLIKIVVALDPSLEYKKILIKLIKV